MRKIAMISLALVLSAVLTMQCFALGDDITYSDGGGGGWSSSDSYDSYDSYSSDSSTYYYSDYGDGIELRFPVFLVVLAFIIFVAILSNQSNKQTHSHTQNHTQSQTQSRQQDLDPLPVDQDSISQLRQRDPQFSSGEVESMVKRWVMEFEQAWSDGDMTPYKDCIGENLFSTYQSQLAVMQQNNEASRTEDLAVMNCQISKWFLDGPRECLDVWIKVKKRTYKVALDDPSILVKGFVDTIYEVSYLWQLTRPAITDADNDSQEQEGAKQQWVLNKVDKLGQMDHY